MITKTGGICYGHTKRAYQCNKKLHPIHISQRLTVRRTKHGNHMERLSEKKRNLPTQTNYIVNGINKKLKELDAGEETGR